MASYQVIPAVAVARARNTYPTLDWPADHLAIGQAFVIYLVDGCDSDGRSEAYLRVLAGKLGRRLGRKFSCNKIDDGLAISRIA